MSGRNDTSMALSIEDKVFVRGVKGTLGLKTDKEALAIIISAYRDLQNSATVQGYIESYTKKASTEA